MIRKKNNPFSRGLANLKIKTKGADKSAQKRTQTKGNGIKREKCYKMRGENQLLKGPGSWQFEVDQAEKG